MFMLFSLLLPVIFLVDDVDSGFCGFLLVVWLSSTVELYWPYSIYQRSENVFFYYYL